MDLGLFTDQPKQLKQKIKKKITAHEEWPLVIFTLLSAILVSIYAAELTNNFTLGFKIIYLFFGALAALLSMLHLGKKLRAWRSITNIQNSWLSREIAIVFAFLCRNFL
jgi:DMSO reductase anchor subunit